MSLRNQKKLKGVFEVKMPKINQQTKILCLSFLFLIGAYLIFGIKSDPIIKKTDKIFADTLIPNGLILVPIELANVDTVSALIDQFAVVDLFSSSANSKGNKKIASRVKLLRAPLNPNQYAILAPQRISDLIMSTPGPFWAVIQNREAKQDPTKETASHTVRIEYHQSGADL
jgi:hypothetical protein